MLLIFSVSVLDNLDYLSVCLPVCFYFPNRSRLDVFCFPKHESSEMAQRIFPKFNPTRAQKNSKFNLTRARYLSYIKVSPFKHSKIYSFFLPYFFRIFFRIFLSYFFYLFFYVYNFYIVFIYIISYSFFISNLSSLTLTVFIYGLQFIKEGRIIFLISPASS